jgi:outer membrane protein insertion porin family
VEINNTRAVDNRDIFHTIQLSGGTSFSIPRLWPPFRWIVKRPDAGRTFLNFNGGYTSRTNFFDLRNLNLTFGYEWKKNNNIFTINAANFELVDLNPTQSFQELINSNRVLSYSFNQGVVLGVSAIFQRNFFYPKHTNWSSYMRITAEESGAITGGLFFKDRLLRFWKLDGEFRHSILHAKHKWAFRAIGGFGRDFSSSSKPLPFFRQFIAGGPNSMRAWRLRQLGLGSSLAQDTLRQLSKGSQGQDTLIASNFKDRLGDIYMEVNAEYRFAMFKAFTFPIEGALFVDAGNIWARNAAIAGSEDGVFRLGNLYKDLAVAAGYGIRWDFGYLRVRLDIAYKLKDPVREGSGWFKTLEWRTVNRSTTVPVENRNIGIQFGIDYPF